MSKISYVLNIHSEMKFTFSELSRSITLLLIFSCFLKIYLSYTFKMLFLATVIVCVMKLCLRNLTQARLKNADL